jgi:MoxR-like ATPase
MVMATQNPLEQEGTYPLPEAELDRFMMKVCMDFPSVDDEIKLTGIITHSTEVGAEEVVENLALKESDLLQAQMESEAITIDQQVIDYAVRIVRATRDHPSIYRGAGSRACISLVQTAKSLALMSGRTYVIPDDIKEMALPVIRHRIALSPDVEIEGLDASDILTQMLADIEAPRQ